MLASTYRKRGRKPLVNPDHPNYNELKREFTKSKTSHIIPPEGNIYIKYYILKNGPIYQMHFLDKIRKIYRLLILGYYFTKLENT